MIEIDTLKSYSKIAAEHLYGLLDGALLKDKALSMNHKLYADVGLRNTDESLALPSSEPSS